MDWITGIQKAIDYIESHITEELDYQEIAENAFSSPWHFQRVFSILCGYTLGEYIRSRRLALAGAELAADKIRVIDAAVKYGYDSPDSFTKAFTRFHGITPSAAREPGAKLCSFTRLGKIKNGREMGNRSVCGFPLSFPQLPQLLVGPDDSIPAAFLGVIQHVIRNF